MMTTEFIGPDGSILLYRHGEKCECSTCEEAKWRKIERDEISCRGQYEDDPFIHEVDSNGNHSPACECYQLES